MRRTMMKVLLSPLWVSPLQSRLYRVETWARRICGQNVACQSEGWKNPNRKQPKSPSFQLPIGTESSSLLDRPSGVKDSVVQIEDSITYVTQLNLITKQRTCLAFWTVISGSTPICCLCMQRRQGQGWIIDVDSSHAGWNWIAFIDYRILKVIIFLLIAITCVNCRQIAFVVSGCLPFCSRGATYSSKNGCDETRCARPTQQPAENLDNRVASIQFLELCMHPLWIEILFEAA